MITFRLRHDGNTGDCENMFILDEGAKERDDDCNDSRSFINKSMIYEEIISL